MLQVKMWYTVTLINQTIAVISSLTSLYYITENMLPNKDYFISFENYFYMCVWTNDVCTMMKLWLVKACKISIFLSLLHLMKIPSPEKNISICGNKWKNISWIFSIIPVVILFECSLRESSSRYLCFYMQ